MEISNNEVSTMYRYGNGHLYGYLAGRVAFPSPNVNRMNDYDNMYQMPDHLEVKVFYQLMRQEYPPVAKKSLRDRLKWR